MSEKMREKLSIRVSAADKENIRKAAGLDGRGKTISAFMLDIACARAAELLAIDSRVREEARA